MAWALSIWTYKCCIVVKMFSCVKDIWHEDHDRWRDAIQFSGHSIEWAHGKFECVVSTVHGCAFTYVLVTRHHKTMIITITAISFHLAKKKKYRKKIFKSKNRTGCTVHTKERKRKSGREKEYKKALNLSECFLRWSHTL